MRTPIISPFASPSPNWVKSCAARIHGELNNGAAGASPRVDGCSLVKLRERRQQLRHVARFFVLSPLSRLGSSQLVIHRLTPPATCCRRFHGCSSRADVNYWHARKSCRTPQTRLSPRVQEMCATGLDGPPRSLQTPTPVVEAIAPAFQFLLFSAVGFADKHE